MKGDGEQRSPRRDQKAGSESVEQWGADGRHSKKAQKRKAPEAQSRRQTGRRNAG